MERRTIALGALCAVIATVVIVLVREPERARRSLEVADAPAEQPAAVPPAIDAPRDQQRIEPSIARSATPVPAAENVAPSPVPIVRGDGDGSGEVVTLRGLAQDQQGAPLARTRLAWTVARIGLGPSGRETLRAETSTGVLRTDDKGAFVVQVARPREIADTWRELSLSSDDVEPRRGAVRIDRLDARELDVGVVMLAVAPVLVRGTAVDGSGTPVDGARVSIWDRGDAYGGDAARYGRIAGCVTGRDGRFEVRGFTSATTLALWVTHPEYRQATRENVRIPSDDLRIVLTRSTQPTVRMRVRLDDERCAPWIAVRSAAQRSSTASEDGWFVFGWPVDEHRAFVLTFGQAGSFDVEVYVSDTGQVLERIADVVVPASGRCEDPRLLEVDLRGRLDSVRVSFTTRSGRVLPHAKLPSRGPADEIVADDEGFAHVPVLLGSPARAPLGLDAAPTEIVEGARVVVAED